MKGHGSAEKAVGEAESTICGFLQKGVHVQLRRGGEGGRCGRAYTCMTNLSGISSGPHADESPKLKLKRIFLSQQGEPGMWTSRRS